MPTVLNIYHCEYGLIESLRTNQVTFTEMQTLGTFQSVVDDLDVALDHAMITYPDGFQEQNPAPSYLVTYRHGPYISPYQAYGTIKEAVRAMTGIMASKLVPKTPNE